MSGFLSIAARIRFEPDKTKGSRHIATLVPIREESQVAAELANLRTEFPQANHHPYAWRMGPGGEQFSYSDDGEPSGSAGRPILQHLEGRGVTQVLLAVSRVFGGTKLGVGGLVRAYGGAAAAILDAAEIITVVPRVRLRVRFPYGCSNAMQSLLHSREHTTLDACYDEAVRLDLEVLEAESREIEREIRDGTGDRATVEWL